MISSLWTLCQTCPSVAAGKLDAQHGKYRWTEYRDVSTAARVIEHAPQNSGHSLTESSARSHHDAATANQEQQQPLLDNHDHHHQSQGKQQQKRHPSDSHDFMEFTAIPAYLKFDNQQLLQGLRRSQSEGPGPQYHHSVRGANHGVGAAAETGLMAAWVHGRRRHVTEQQRPEHWLISAPASAAGSVLAVETRAPTVQERQQAQQQQQQNSWSSSSSVVQQQQQQQQSNKRSEFNWPAGKPSRRMPESLDSLLHFTNEVPAVDTPHHQQQKHHYHQMDSSIQTKHTNDDHQQQNDQEQPRARRRYKTEYNKKYRPFSVYQYVDGRFQKSSSAADKIDSHDPKDPWYGEVVELRKKAGEYKYRGLGGEMMPDHMVDLYAKQFDVWEQVSRRSSLSALALAAISPRATPDKENKTALSSASSSSGERRARGGSPAKTLPLGNHQAARPGHAQLVLISTRRANSKQAECAERPRRDVSQQRSYSAEGGSKARSKSVKPASKSPANVPLSSVSSSPSSTQTAAHGSTARQSAGNHANHQRAPPRSASVGPERRMPTGRSSGAPSGAPVTRTTPVKAPRSSSAAAHNNNVDVKENAEAVKVVKKKDEDKADAACGQVPSVAEPEMPALIKSFPEPTRVKSPEQLVVRSPDPVNWTVPLDTAKTFTVTQNIAATKPQSELKVTMTVRPAPPAHPVAVLKPHVQQPQQHESAAELKEIVVAKEEIAEDRAQSPATSSAPTASSHSAPEKDKGEEREAALETEEDDRTIGHDEPVITKQPEAVESSPPVAHHPLCAPEEPRADATDAAANQIDSREPSDPTPPVTQPIAEAKVEKAKAPEEKPQTPVKPDEAPQAADAVVPSDPLNVTAVLSKPKDEPLAAAVRPVGPVIVPGTTLRRLEDPTPVLFSRPGTLGSLTGAPFASVAAPAPVAPKGPRYRVLEAPGLEPLHPVHHHVEPSHSMPTSSPYKVLEAPASPPKAGAGLAGSPSASPQSSSRSLASDVLEKARTRFDRFWTKKDSDK